MTALKISDLKTFDASEYLEDERACAEYLTAAMEDGDSALIVAALGDIAKARGMSQVAKDAGITREGLYKALSSKGNPSFSTVLKVLRSLGMQVSVAPIPQVLSQ